jgi:hypothetical protein
MWRVVAILCLVAMPAKAAEQALLVLTDLGRRETT